LLFFFKNSKVAWKLLVHRANLNFQFLIQAMFELNLNRLHQLFEFA
jgi:hypothetical protein